MTGLLYTLALALAPVMFIFTLVYLQDKYEREPLRHLIVCFVLGIAIAIPAVFGEIFMQSLLGVEGGPNVLETLIYAMVVVAAVEEGLKFLVVRFYMFKKPEFDEPYDGIMYAVAVSLGFAAIENVLYIVQYGAATGWLRMFTAIPGHAMFAVLMGYYMGRAKFLHDPKKSPLEMAKGLLAAILVHGLYDYFLFLEDAPIYIPLLAFVVLIVGIVLGVRAMRLHQQVSPHKHAAAQPEAVIVPRPVPKPKVVEKGNLKGSMLEEDE